MIETREKKNKKLDDDIKKEERHEIIKKRCFKILKIISICALTIICFILYMHYIGTKGIVVREYKVSTNKIDDAMHGLKIVHFSDLNYLSTIKEKEVKSLVKKINEIKPDIVLFTGDLIAEDAKLTENDIKFLIKELNSIDASIGIYAIKGDKDYKNKEYDKVISETNFTIINNSYELVYYNGNTPILLTGCGSILNDDCDLGQTFSFNEMDNLYTISLIHETDTANTIDARYKPDIILAGHNLNGQIRLPLIGGMIKVVEGKKFMDYKYNLSNSTLFVSGGLGTDKSGYRLFNHPSINFYRLVKET